VQGEHSRYRELAMVWTLRYSNTCRSKRFFFSLKVQTCPGAYDVSSLMGTGVLPRGGVKRYDIDLGWQFPALYVVSLSVILSDKHNSTDQIHWFLFSTATGFGRLHQPSSGRHRFKKKQ